MSEQEETIIIKRYASRRLYNTELSDYVTLEEVAGYIKDGKNIQIIDRKTGDDLTRQYLLQIITDYESRGENILPINVLMDIVRSYSDQAHNFIPDFLAQSFDMLKQQQQETLKAFQENFPGAIPPMPASPLEGFEKWKELQSDFLNQMMGTWAENLGAGTAPEMGTEEEPEAEEPETEPAPKPKKASARKTAPRSKKNSNEEIEALKKQLASLQSKLDDL